MSNELYVSALTQRLEEVKAEIEDLQSHVQGLFASIEDKQRQAHHIMELLQVEGQEIEQQDLKKLGDVQVSDIAFEILEASDKRDPIHYRELAKKILSSGTRIPGKDPAANLLSHINRDDRFVRVAPGTYALENWGFEAMPKPRRKPKRRKRKIT
jgi:hypothetical protein